MECNIKYDSGSGCVRRLLTAKNAKCRFTHVASHHSICLCECVSVGNNTIPSMCVLLPWLFYYLFILFFFSHLFYFLYCVRMISLWSLPSHMHAIHTSTPHTHTHRFIPRPPTCLSIFFSLKMSQIHSNTRYIPVSWSNAPNDVYIFYESNWLLLGCRRHIWWVTFHCRIHDAHRSESMNGPNANTKMVEKWNDKRNKPKHIANGTYTRMRGPKCVANIRKVSKSIMHRLCTWSATEIRLSNGIHYYYHFERRWFSRWNGIDTIATIVTSHRRLHGMEHVANKKLAENGGGKNEAEGVRLKYSHQCGRRHTIFHFSVWFRAGRWVAVWECAKQSHHHQSVSIIIIAVAGLQPCVPSMESPSHQKGRLDVCRCSYVSVFSS